MKQKKTNTRLIRENKIVKGYFPLQMLTCYDFQTAQVLDQTELDLILVGDSLGNVVLGYETTIEVTLEEMIIFSCAVKRGAQNKFVIADLPFGTYSTFDSAIKNAVKLFQKSKIEALKLEGADSFKLDIIRRLVAIGIPIMGHIGLLPQSVHEMGGYFQHGKDILEEQRLIEEAKNLEASGVFAVVLECIKPEIASKITEELNIPTIGIGAGGDVDGQVLVLNDLLKCGKERPPSFCTPVANFFEMKKTLIEKYLKDQKYIKGSEFKIPQNNSTDEKNFEHIYL